MSASDELRELFRTLLRQRDEAVEHVRQTRLELLELRHDYQTLADRLHAVERDRNEDYLF